jgi:hypothetical protein
MIDGKVGARKAGKRQAKVPEERRSRMVSELTLAFL